MGLGSPGNATATLQSLLVSYTLISQSAQQSGRANVLFPARYNSPAPHMTLDPYANSVSFGVPGSDVVTVIGDLWSQYTDAGNTTASLFYWNGVEAVVLGSGSGGIITGGGSPGTIVKFSSATNITDSIITEAGSVVTVAGTLNAQSGSTSQYGLVLLSDSTGSTSTAIAATSNAIKQVKDYVESLSGSHSHPGTPVPASDITYGTFGSGDYAFPNHVLIPPQYQLRSGIGTGGFIVLEDSTDVFILSSAGKVNFIADNNTASGSDAYRWKFGSSQTERMLLEPLGKLTISGSSAPQLILRDPEEDADTARSYIEFQYGAGDSFGYVGACSSSTDDLYIVPKIGSLYFGSVNTTRWYLGSSGELRPTLQTTGYDLGTAAYPVKDLYVTSSVKFNNNQTILSPESNVNNSGYHGISIGTDDAARNASLAPVIISSSAATGDYPYGTIWVQV